MFLFTFCGSLGVQALLGSMIPHDQSVPEDVCVCGVTAFAAGRRLMTYDITYTYITYVSVCVACACTCNFAM